jgi:pantetheine-phosphate adenylyltransferase
MKRCIFPGTFDPITNGHMNIIERAGKIFDEVTVLILVNAGKRTLFEEELRYKFITEAVADKKFVKVDRAEGLLTEYCRKHGCYTVVRGIRNGVDFEYEMQYFGINRILSPEIEMFFLPTTGENLYVSSGNARELILHNRSVERLVPACVDEEIQKMFKDKG